MFPSRIPNSNGMADGMRRARSIRLAACAAASLASCVTYRHGSISIAVRDADSKQPIAKAWVELSEHSPPYGLHEVRIVSGFSSATLLADDSGELHVPDIAMGFWSLSVDAEGYDLQGDDFDFYSTPSQANGVWMLLHNFRRRPMAPGKRIEVRVVDNDHPPANSESPTPDSAGQ